MDLRPLLSIGTVATARSAIVASDARTFAEQLHIVTIPAPTFDESVRGQYLRKRFVEVGLLDVAVDGVGNVLARLPGSASQSNSAVLVVSAHLDTVFPAGTALEPRRVGDRVFAPGIADNARGLAALIAIADALTIAQVQTTSPLWFVGTVGEEGNGDLRGVKHLFGNGFPGGRIDRFISLDGSGLRRVVHRAIGARRLRVRVTGPGGHSWADWGAPNPVHALANAISRITVLPLSDEHRTTLTVSRIGGGTSVNAIPEEAWLEADLRSEDSHVLKQLEFEVRRVLTEAVAREARSHGRGTGSLKLEISRIGERPAGMASPDSSLVAGAMAATRVVGARPELAASSTDANVPLALGVPAITIGAGGDSGGIHTFDEWYTNEDGARGLDRALLTVLAAAGVTS